MCRSSVTGIEVTVTLLCMIYIIYVCFRYYDATLARIRGKNILYILLSRFYRENRLRWGILLLPY